MAADGTVDGTVSRDALGLDTDYVPPAGPTEAVLAASLARLLSLDRVGAQDDFFALGGDSVAAAALFAEIESRLGQALPFSVITRTPTVAGLAAVIERGPAAEDAAQLGDLGADGPLPPLFLVHGAAGVIFLRPGLRAALGADLPVHGIRARGLLGRLPPHRSVAAMAEEYLGLVRGVAPRGRCFIGGVCIGSLVAFEMAHRLAAEGTPPLGVLLVDPLARKPAPFEETVDLDALQGSRAGRDFLDKLRQRTRNLGGAGLVDAPQEEDLPRLLRGAIAVQAALDAASRGYRFPPYPHLISLYCSTPQYDAIRDNRGGWQAAARGRAKLWHLAHDHAELFAEKGPDLGRAMRSDIDAALARRAGRGSG